ncbi:MAG TPA: SRPBCC family protein [Actinomycetota bacterium]|nr:SRPBCC family protein [Actinomycetota bacterium]
MLIENGFTVGTPVDQLWAFLLDVERIAPCMPGAELTDTVDDTTWKGKVNVRFGPVTMAFAGTVEMTERDDAAHRAVLRAKGTEQRGKGAANATVTSWLEPADGGRTTVKMTADITLSGAAAQMSRGLLPEISRKLTQQFADCLEAAVAAVSGSPLDAGEVPAGPVATGASVAETDDAPGVTGARAPVGGIRLGLSALWSLVVGFFRRLFGGGRSPT